MKKLRLFIKLRKISRFYGINKKIVSFIEMFFVFKIELCLLI